MPSSKSASDTADPDSSRASSPVHSYESKTNTSDSSGRTVPIADEKHDAHLRETGSFKTLVTLKTFTNRQFLISEQQKLIENDDTDFYPPGKIKSHSSKPASIKENPKVSVRVDLLPANRVNISDTMRSLNKYMYGKFLLCRTITPPIKMNALMTVVDDPDTCDEDIAVCIALYNYTSDDTVDPSNILPLGTIMAIKNPLFKNSADGGYIIRCDNPAHVKILSERTLERVFPTLRWKTKINAEFKYPTPEVFNNLAMKVEAEEDSSYWKSVGDYMLNKCRYTAALDAYDKSLVLEPYNLETLIQRSVTYLRVKNYDKCLNDAMAVLEDDPFHETALYHKIHSFVGLRQYEDAVNCLEWYINEDNIHTSYEHQKNMAKLLQKVRNCDMHQKTGKYDFNFIMKCPRTHIHDCGEYIGPVEIVLFEEKGRGTVARKNIYAGDIIHCTKAFAMGFPDENVPAAGTDVTTTQSEVLLTSPYHRLVTAVAQRVMNDPDSGKLIYKLYAGPDLKWLDSNSEGVTEEKLTTVDMKRIDGICTYNAFYGDAGDNGENDRCCGIWTISSFINHSCYDCNCTWRMHGDLLMIRATRDISKGEEILTTYISPCELYSSRQQTFNSYGFDCGCSLCKVDREDSLETEQKRRHFLKKFDRTDARSYATVNVDGVIETMERCIEELIDLRPANPHMNIYIIHPLYQLAMQYYSKKEYGKAANLLKNAHQIVSGTVLVDSSLSCAINAMNCYLKARNFKKAKKAAKLVEKELCVAYGASASMEVLHAVAEEDSLVDEIEKSGIKLDFSQGRNS